MEQITLSKKMNLEGDVIVTESVFVNETGLLVHERLNCHSAIDYGFGTCRCQNHPTWMARTLTNSEWQSICAERGIEWVPNHSLNQMCYDQFGHTLPEIESFCETSYNVGANPLPHLRGLTMKQMGVELDVQYSCSTPYQNGWTLLHSRNDDGAHICELVHYDNGVATE